MFRSNVRRYVTVSFVLLVGLAVGSAVLQLGTPIVRDANAVCIAGICGPTDPPVRCSNGKRYINICAANAACQYNCKPTIKPEPEL